VQGWALAQPMISTRWSRSITPYSQPCPVAAGDWAPSLVNRR
jgi:hypothetical protein